MSVGHVRDCVLQSTKLVLQAVLPVLRTTMLCPSQGTLTRRDTARRPLRRDQKQKPERATQPCRRHVHELVDSRFTLFRAPASRRSLTWLSSNSNKFAGECHASPANFSKPRGSWGVYDGLPSPSNWMTSYERPIDGLRRPSYRSECRPIRPTSAVSAIHAPPSRL
jgi:hypothetical protein